MELAVAVACELGENPLWNPDDGRLYWVDIPHGRLYRWAPAAAAPETFALGAPTGGFTFQADGSLLLFMADGAVRTWRDGQLTTVIETIPAVRGSRFNDVIADPAGRVFCGTLPCADGRARLYRLDPDATLTLVLDDLALSNGLGFTPDRTGLYLTDSPARTIRRFRYDAATGTIDRPNVFARLTEDEGYPDGLTVDAAGHVWSARWGGGCVVRYAPDGRLQERLCLPVRNVTSAAFGGPARHDLYITTARQDSPPTDEHAGAVFRIQPAVGGGPEFRSRVGLGRGTERGLLGQ